MKPVVIIHSTEMLKKFGKPLLGCYSDGTIYIRSELKFDTYYSVLAHEVYHSEDTSNDGLFMREFKANLAGFKASPIGWLDSLRLTIFDRGRIKMYLNYFKG